MSRKNDDDEDGKRGMSRRALLTFWRRPLVEAVEVAQAGPPKPLSVVPRPPPLRPPGMLHEMMLLKHCLHCGKCVEACPAGAIFPLGDDWGSAAGTPAIEPRQQPCVLCHGLKCTQVCPSGALQPLSANHEVTMGTARVDEGRCLTWQGRACTACIAVCPQSALRFDDAGKLQVVEDKCVGCGLCERACPTQPQSIRIQPRA
jgi:ferredoxin-type protein NapG